MPTSIELNSSAGNGMLPESEEDDGRAADDALAGRALRQIVVPGPNINV